MFEFVQGEGGVIPLEKSFINAIFDICKEKDIITIADEVQTGMGRTGAILTSKLYDVKPDVTTLAKGLAGGIPIGACLSNEKCSNVLTAGTHGSTFGGNPIACAGGNVVLNKVMNFEFISEITKKSEYIINKLKNISEIEKIDGLGLMLGLQLKTKKSVDVVKEALEKGLLILTAKEKARLLPPLTISYEEIDKAIEILNSILK